MAPTANCVHRPKACQRVHYGTNRHAISNHQTNQLARPTSMTEDPNQSEKKAAVIYQGSSTFDSFTVAAWCFKAIGFILVMGLGAIYGVIAYKYFLSMGPANATSRSALMLDSFLVGVPLAIGVVVGFFTRRRRLAGFGGGIALSSLAVTLFAFASGSLLREGTICIVMAIPIFVVVALIGGILGIIIGGQGGPKGPMMLSAVVLIPGLLAPLENELPQQTVPQSTVRSIHIKARPEVIWQHLNFPLDIKPSELPDGFAYRIGVPYPIEARTIEGRVGGKRELRWQRGVSFDEIITVWQPNQSIAWTYHFRPDSFPTGSLDDHIVIGGRYFNLVDTSYTLQPEGNGTRLSINVGTSVTTNFNWYAGLWARFLIGDTAESILQFYKNRSEHPAMESKAG